MKTRAFRTLSADLSDTSNTSSAASRRFSEADNSLKDRTGPNARDVTQHPPASAPEPLTSITPRLKEDIRQFDHVNTVNNLITQRGGDITDELMALGYKPAEATDYPEGLRVELSSDEIPPRLRDGANNVAMLVIDAKTGKQAVFYRYQSGSNVIKKHLEKFQRFKHAFSFEVKSEPDKLIIGRIHDGMHTSFSIAKHEDKKAVTLTAVNEGGASHTYLLDLDEEAPDELSKLLEVSLRRLRRLDHNFHIDESSERLSHNESRARDPSARHSQRLTSTGRDCFVNSAIQFWLGTGMDLKNVWRGIAPHLHKLTMQRVDANRANEARGDVAKLCGYASTQVAASIGHRGYATQQDDAAMVVERLLESSEAPVTMLNSTIRDGEDGEIISEIYAPLLMHPLKVPEEGSARIPTTKDLMTRDWKQSLPDYKDAGKDIPNAVQYKMISGEAPDQLYFQLNRYHYDAQRFNHRKLKTNIDVTQQLDVQTCDNINNEKASYAVKGIIVHLGNTVNSSGGHYIYYEKRENGWMMKEDDREELIDDLDDPKNETHKERIMRNAYVVSYQRIKDSDVPEQPSHS